MKHESDYLAFLIHTRDYSPKTAEAYRQAIDDLEKTVGVEDPVEIRTEHFDQYMTRKALAGTSSSTRRMRVYAQKAFFRWLLARKLIAEDPAAAIVPPEQRRGGIPTFTQAEITKLLFELPELKEPKRGRRENDLMFQRRRIGMELRPLRDSALLGLGYQCGLRAAELGQLKLEDLEFDEKRPRLYVTGKGAREPVAMRLDPKITGLVVAYLRKRQMLGIQNAALFPPLCGRRGEREDGVSPETVRKILLERVASTGIVRGRRRISPHILRYSLATHLDANGLGTPQIQVVLRHKSIETTIGYIRRGSSRSIQDRAIARLPWNCRDYASE